MSKNGKKPGCEAVVLGVSGVGVDGKEKVKVYFKRKMEKEWLIEWAELKLQPQEQESSGQQR